MTDSEKTLLLSDLCARLPYGVQFESYGIAGSVHRLYDIGYGGSELNEPIINHGYGISEIKPYLRRMSSMTDNEKTELYRECHTVLLTKNERECEMVAVPNAVLVSDWFNRHHIDHHALIEKGLAIEAPEYMYKNS